MKFCSSLLMLIVACFYPTSAQDNGDFWWLQGGAFGNSTNRDVPFYGYDEPDNSELSYDISNYPVKREDEPPTFVDSTGAVDLSNYGYDTCFCIEYHLCSSDGVIITSGEFALDVRLNQPAANSAACPGTQLCCRLPPETADNTPVVVPLPAPVTTKLPVVQQPPSEEFQPGLCGTSHLLDSDNIDEAHIRLLDVDGNTETEFGEFPWMLMLLRQNGAKMVYTCGASLIQPGVALTAAHCVQGLKASDLIVRAGEWEAADESESLEHQDAQVQTIILHPGFNRAKLFNDVALLVLSQSFTLKENVDVVCLPEQDAVFDGNRCVATGWGKNAIGDEGEFSTVMRMVELPIVPSNDCQASLRTTRKYRHLRLHDSFICAGGEEGKDTCQGDGGGPLVCPLPGDPSRFVQVGIVAWGIGCGQDKIPAVYANVAKFQDWIDQTLLNLV